MSRRRSLGAIASALVVAGAVLSVASAGTITGRDSSGGAVRGKGLTQKERKALDVVSVTATGIEPLGTLVTATFAGDIEQTLGRGHLSDGLVVLILRPKDPRLAFSGVATFGSGTIGLTARKTRTRDVGVVRAGRKVTFFVGGPGFENVGRIEIKTFAAAPRVSSKRLLQAAGKEPRKDVSPELWEEIGKAIAADEAALPAPSADTRCSELEGMKAKLDGLLKSARKWEVTLEKTQELIRKTIPEMERSLRDSEFEQGAATFLAFTNALVSGPALLLVPPLGAGLGASALALSEAGRSARDRAQALRDLIRSLKLDLRLAEAYLAKVRALIGNIRELVGKVDAMIAVACEKPEVLSIGARFNRATFTTTYTVAATGSDLRYRWSVAIPDDAGCAAGFKGNDPAPHQATWFHKDTTEGGICDHDVRGPRGHPGKVTVVVSNRYWRCTATYDGTEGDNGEESGFGPKPGPCTED